MAAATTPAHLQRTYKLIDDYRTWAKVRKGDSETTVYGRWCTLRSLATQFAGIHDKFQGGDCPQVRFTDASSEQLLSLLDARGLNPQPRGDYTRTLHSFFVWVDRYGHRKVSRAKGWEAIPTLADLMPRPGFKPPKPRTMPDTDVQRAVDLAPGLRHRTMLLLAAEAGLRCIEIARLDPSWVDMTTNQLHVFGKGDKRRAVSMTYDVRDCLNECLRHDVLPFVQTGGICIGQPMSAGGVSATMNSYLRSIGIPLTMHKLRGRFADAVYEASGWKLTVVQELLGHSNLETTRRYLSHANVRERQLAVDMASLSARKLRGAA